MRSNVYWMCWPGIEYTPRSRCFNYIFFFARDFIILFEAMNSSGVYDKTIIY